MSALERLCVLFIIAFSLLTTSESVAENNCSQNQLQCPRSAAFSHADYLNLKPSERKDFLEQNFINLNSPEPSQKNYETQLKSLIFQYIFAITNKERLRMKSVLRLDQLTPLGRKHFLKFKVIVLNKVTQQQSKFIYKNRKQKNLFQKSDLFVAGLENPKHQFRNFNDCLPTVKRSIFLNDKKVHLSMQEFFCLSLMIQGKLKIINRWCPTKSSFFRINKKLKMRLEYFTFSLNNTPHVLAIDTEKLFRFINTLQNISTGGCHKEFRRSWNDNLHMLEFSYQKLISYIKSVERFEHDFSNSKIDQLCEGEITLEDHFLLPLQAPFIFKQSNKTNIVDENQIDKTQPYLKFELPRTEINPYQTTINKLFHSNSREGHKFECTPMFFRSSYYNTYNTRKSFPCPLNHEETHFECRFFLRNSENQSCHMTLFIPKNQKQAALFSKNKGVMDWLKPLGAHVHLNQEALIKKSDTLYYQRPRYGRTKILTLLKSLALRTKIYSQKKLNQPIQNPYLTPSSSR